MFAAHQTKEALFYNQKDNELFVAYDPMHRSFSGDLLYLEFEFIILDTIASHHYLDRTKPKDLILIDEWTRP